MDASFLIAPQWQGSGSTRALQLTDGANAIRSDLPSSRTRVIDVPLGAGESLGSGVRRISAIQIVRDRCAEALADTTGLVVTIGGDCGVELAPVSHALAGHADDLALVWFDAHPDVNTPESSPSGAFHGMVLRTLLGDGFPSLVPDAPFPSDRVVLAGARAFDEPEAEWIAERGIRMLPPGELGADSLIAAIEATGAGQVYLHIDLDVLDPAEFSSLGYPEPFGLSLATLLEAIRAVGARFPIAGAGLCEFAPSSAESAADDLPTILRIIAAITA
ncbi:arginase [Cryobacterium mesophilum]|uniref:Arginase family protein n=1 Tax=Terrimesophilobacter mesophilus TaxID=433647 RepID=A0A4R8V812_9MICO|nr:arginase family protein [Terrimesophilobacter mesophilus]MBB5632451.1 arginase [Terrimesophilobacter mesophilus]TFB79281.1 arginase family protein [Terrimesophilobacter mesophilus]